MFWLFPPLNTPYFVCHSPWKDRKIGNKFTRQVCCLLFFHLLFEFISQVAHMSRIERLLSDWKICNWPQDSFMLRQQTISSETLVIFSGETPWNRPTWIITFSAITQEGVEQWFSSSNSIDISIRRLYAQNLITIGLSFEELSCIRPAGRTNWPIL